MRVELLTRPGCQLCGPARVTVTEVCERTGQAWTEVNVDADPELRAEYGDRVPVVLVDGREVAALLVDPADLDAALAG